MENASKALLLAGSVLISIVVIGALVLMFKNLTAYQEGSNQNTREAEVKAFNQIFLSYNRKDIRGNDIVSLINKVVDYNERKSLGDEAQDLKYQPIKIIVDLNGYRNQLPIDGEYRFFTQDKYTQDNNINTLGNILAKVSEIEKDFISVDVLTKLTNNLNNLYDIDENNTEQKNKANELYKSLIPKRVTISREEAEEDLKAYYEYIQFKRAHFDSVSSELLYNESTGRIVQMGFKMTGKFE